MSDRASNRRPIRPPPRFVQEYDDVSDRKLLIALQNSLLDQGVGDRSLELQEAPVLYPTPEEFADPVTYIASIEGLGKSTGILKIVPPSGWRLPVPHFAEDIPFETKRQRLDKLQEGALYGDGNNYTLPEYQRMANKYTKTRYPDLVYSPHTSEAQRSAMEARVEERFWMAVESSDAVSVDYANDLDIRVHGSGFPKCTDPIVDAVVPMSAPDFYQRTGWNLNNLPYIPGSVLRHVSQELPGVTVPWLYYGMLFATFAWHTEDNHFPSINYMHSGAPKTWYGVPTDDAPGFERVFQAHAAEQLEKDPALLYNLTTLVPPKQLLKRGVPVYHLVQRAGEYVITFPRAYHSGFSHGHNRAEAVNFALATWLPYGRQCIKRYRRMQRASALVHEQLVFALAQSVDELTGPEAQLLLTEIQAVRDEEAASRHAAEIAGVPPSTTIVPFTAGNAHDCGLCDRTLILSEVYCTAPEHAGVVVCCEHARKLCLCPISSRAMRVFCSLEDIDEVTKVVKRRVKKLGVPPAAGSDVVAKPPGASFGGKPAKKSDRKHARSEGVSHASAGKMRVVSVEAEVPPVASSDLIDLTNDEEALALSPTPPPAAASRSLCDLCFEDIEVASAKWLASLATPLPFHEVETMKSLPPSTCCLSCKLDVQTSVDQWNSWCEL